MPPKFGQTTDDAREYARNSERATLLNLDDSDDDRIFSGPSPYRNNDSNPNDNIAKVKNEIKSVVNVMQNNISKVLDRGEKIDDLQDKSENLEMNAFQFRSGSRRLQKKMWWQNCRLLSIYRAGSFMKHSTNEGQLKGYELKLIFVFVIIIILVIIIVPIVIKNKKKT